MASIQPSKTRVLWLIIAGAIVIYLALSFFTSKRPVMESVQVTMSGPPSIASVPGSVKDNPRYKELQEQANKQQAEAAKKSGRSALPTLVNKTKEGQTDEEFFQDLKKQAPAVSNKNDKDDALKKAQEDADRRLKDQQARLDKLKKEQDDKRKAAETSRAEQQKNQQQAKELEGLVSAIMTEMGNVTKIFAPPSKQQYVSGQSTTTPADNKKGGNTNPNQMTAQNQNNTMLPASPAPAVPPLYKAGSIVYGVLETSYDSDDGGPVLVKITTGPLAGSRVIGTVANPGTWANGIGITFNTISMPYAAHSQSISLQAVDPGTLRPTIHSVVNYHYGQRYGALLLAGAISQGASQASSGSSSSSSSGGSSSSSTTTQGSGPTSATNGLASIGTPVANDIVSSLTSVGSRPPTYRVEQGASVGLMFTSDFTPTS